jgi:hypothetical protein
LRVFLSSEQQKDQFNVVPNDNSSGAWNLTMSKEAKCVPVASTAGKMWQEDLKTSGLDQPERTPSMRVNENRRLVLRALFAFTVVPALVNAMSSTPAAAASGRIEFRLVRAGLIFGISSGSGTLFFNGQRYRLSVGGVSLGATIGAASVEFVGRVRNLRRSSDIQGNYTAVSAGLAAAGGGGVARLRNSRGVELEVSGRQIGFKASVDLSGLRIRLAR